MAKTSTKDEFCYYVIFFGGDIKKIILLWPEDNNFKALLLARGAIGNYGAQCWKFIYSLCYNWKNMLFKKLLYCTELDCIGIRTYAHRRRQYKRKHCPVGC
jgi:hypothetical protein